MNEPDNVDWEARIVAITSLGLAGIVALIQVFTFRRGRHNVPSLRLAHEFETIIRRPELLVIKTAIHNRSLQPNAVIGISAWLTRLPFFFWRVAQTRLNVGNLATDGGTGLSVAPTVVLYEEEWKVLLTPRGSIPQEGLWRCPIQLPPADAHTLIVALTGAGVDFVAKKRLVVKVKDVLGASHQSKVSL